MPRFVGNDLNASRVLEDNARTVPGYARIAYAQAAKLAPEDLAKSLDTTDRGGRRTYAKRWFRWFGRVEAVAALGTPSALRRAGGAL